MAGEDKQLVPQRDPGSLLDFQAVLGCLGLSADKSVRREPLHLHPQLTDRRIAAPDSRLQAPLELFSLLQADSAKIHTQLIRRITGLQKGRENILCRSLLRGSDLSGRLRGCRPSSRLGRR